MKYLLFVLFLYIIFFSSCCKNPVTPGSTRLKYLWEISENDPLFVDSILSPFSVAFAADNNSFYFHNSAFADNSRMYKISDQGEIIKYSQPIGFHNATSLLLSKDMLYTSSNYKGVYCLNKNSMEVIWHHPNQSGLGDMLVNESMYLYKLGQFSVSCLDINTGNKYWETAIDGIVNGQGDVDDKYLYFSTINVRKDGYLYYINKLTGSIEKKIILPYIEENDAQFGGAGDAGTIEMADKVYSGSTNWYIYCHGKNTGKLVWEFLGDAPIQTDLIISDGLLYAGTLNGSFYALDIDSGKLKWSYKSLSSLTHKPVIYKNYLLLADSDLLVFNKTNGNLIEKLKSSENVPYFYFDLFIKESGQIIISGAKKNNSDLNGTDPILISFQFN